jgi:hypothetical protein
MPRPGIVLQRHIPSSSILRATASAEAINKQMQMMKFDGERWQLFGPIIEDTGVSG